MSDEITPVTGDQAYKAAVARLADQLQGLEATHLVKLRRIGELFALFLEETGAGRYNGATVKTLVEDLQRRGALLHLKDPAHYLYHARRLFAAHPDEHELMELAKAGYTFSHARLLMACSPEAYERWLHVARDNGRFISVASLTIMLENSKLAGTDDAPTERIVEIEPADEPPAPTGPAKAIRSEQIVHPAVPAEPDTPGNTPLPTPKPEPAPAGAKTNTVKTRSVPVKRTMTAAESLMVKLKDESIPNMIIVVRETAQLGSDNPSHLQSYYDQLREFAATARGTHAALGALLEDIDNELKAQDMGK